MPPGDPLTPLSQPPDVRSVPKMLCTTSDPTRLLCQGFSHIGPVRVSLSNFVRELVNIAHRLFFQTAYCRGSVPHFVRENTVGGPLHQARYVRESISACFYCLHCVAMITTPFAPSRGLRVPPTLHKLILYFATRLL
jgi:hypothetical protein